MSPILLFLAYAVILFIAIYAFVYIPNKKKQKSMQELHSSIAPGDVVITMGGIVGTVAEKDGDYVTLVVDKERGTRMQFVLYAISQIKEKNA